MWKGCEPPYPFGKSEEIIDADSRAEAIACVKALRMVSPRYKITAAKIRGSDQPAGLDGLAVQGPTCHQPIAE